MIFFFWIEVLELKGNSSGSTEKWRGLSKNKIITTNQWLYFLLLTIVLSLQAPSDSLLLIAESYLCAQPPSLCWR